MTAGSMVSPKSGERVRARDTRCRDEPAGAWEPFDPEYCRDLEREVLGPINDHYFRVQIFGAHKIPEKGPVILASNHSGNAFPYDAIALDSYLWRRDGMAPETKLRTVFEKELSQVWWMRPFGLDNFWRVGGGVDMTFDNFDRLLERGDRVLYFPEGVPGIGKGFGRRYQLQRFKTSFVLLAARHRTPIIPVYIINAEWVNPFNYTFRLLDRLMQKVFHVPFLPLPAGLVAILWPWAWYLALPARMIFVVGDPIDAAALLRAECVSDPDRPERAALDHVAMKIRHRMQAELTEYATLHGRRPFDARSLFRELRRCRHRFSRVLPTGWPLSFVRHARDRYRPAARNRLTALLRDWDLFFFYLPLGWPFLSLVRRFRRPPCGYRGLPKEQRDRRQGNFVWRLNERPLPPRPGAA
ncbi:MAG: 1-acyl-sn-glycerol-3-phosphate acyltransferase [Gemmatimonadales bacterium]